MAIFEQVEAEKLGPVRSARSYYVEWACPYGALYTHAGGSPQALALLGELDCLYNLEGLAYEGSYFWRGVDPVVPWNNLFTSSDNLKRYIQDWALPRNGEYTGYLHKDDAPLETRPLTGTLAILSGWVYTVRYEYDRDTNTYLRFYKGRPHLDMLTGEQHRAHNVVVIFVEESEIPGDPKRRMEILTTGRGEAMVFRDGIMIPGFWKRPTRYDELRLYNEDGQEVAFNRGNIWIEALSIGQEFKADLGRVP